MKNVILFLAFFTVSCGNTAADSGSAANKEEKGEKASTLEKSEAVVTDSSGKEDVVVSDGTGSGGTDNSGTASSNDVAFKLTAENCVDPDLAKIMKGNRLMLCDGTMAEGTYEPPTAVVPPDLAALTPENIKSGVTVNGVTGTYDNRPAECSSDGEVGCVSTSSYKAILVTALAPNILKYGITIAGVTGTFDNRQPDCTGNGQTGCVATLQYKSADLTNLTADNVKSGVTIAGVTGNYVGGADLTNLTAGNVKYGVVINGVTGTYDNKPANCNGDNQTGCVTTDTYRSLNWSTLQAQNIRYNVVIGGVTGRYPNLTGLDGVAPAGSGMKYLSNTTFEALMRLPDEFQYFDGNGNSHIRTGDPDILPENIRAGVTIFGVTGTLPFESPSPWDVRFNTEIGATTGQAKLQCRSRSGAASDDEKCFGESYEDITSGDDTCVSYPEKCIYRDNISGILISRSGGSKNMTDAQAYCSSLVIDGVSGWRLPDQDELMRMYVQGVQYATGLFPTDTNYYRSSVSNRGVSITSYGFTAVLTPTDPIPTFCVK